MEYIADRSVGLYFHMLLATVSKALRRAEPGGGMSG
jgi:hypothetical protein